MDKALSLESLMSVEDLSEFGLKTEGLVMLQKFLAQVNLKELDIRYPVIIPDFFAMTSYALNDESELKNAYRTLTAGFSQPRIILARSSDPEEMPGKFETHPSLYDPKHPKESFRQWTEAARKVVSSGARAVIAQPMTGELAQFGREYVMRNNGSYWTRYVTSFGADSTGFFGRSHSVIRGDYPSIVACAGLSSKIARGDDDVCFITDGLWREDAIGLACDYDESASQNLFKQKTIDLVMLRTPKKISTIDIDSKALFNNYNIRGNGTPFNVLFGGDETDGAYRLQFSQLFALIDELREFMGSPVEIEASINETGLSIHQLRTYEILKKNFSKLTSIPEDRIISETRLESLGCNQFKGDIYMSDDIHSFTGNGIFLYTGNIRSADINDLAQYPQLVIPLADFSGRIYEHSHSFSYTAQLLIELDKRGVDAIAIDRKMLEPLYEMRYGSRKSDRVEMIGDALKIRDVTVECDGHIAQIYYNEE